MAGRTMQGGLLLALAVLVLGDDVPVPNQRQLDFMEMELVQFMHFGIPTFWDPPKDFLYSALPTYHDCQTTKIDNSSQTGSFFPCLDPKIFNPTNLSVDNWMAMATALGTKEICLTAHHEGGFALWPSNFTTYSIAASPYKGGKGDLLREFADAANRWGIKICYYLNVQSDGFMTDVANYTGDEFITRQLGMLGEVLEHYGPVNRMWFDVTYTFPKHTDVKSLWNQTYAMIRSQSPQTLIGSTRGDICHSIGTVYTTDGPVANSSTDTSICTQPAENGTQFHPIELHGITIQEGPDGNSDASPTFWFWHPWACPRHKPGCPWVGHANASRLFNSYIATVGHGAVLNMNIPPDRSGQMNASVAEAMMLMGKALNDTFGTWVAALSNVSGPCTVGLAELAVADAVFDYVVTMEDLVHGQRIANYSLEYQVAGSSQWLPLVPPVLAARPGSTDDSAAAVETALGDRPDGHDPRDSHIGHKRIDLPVVPPNATAAIGRIRFNCLAALAEPVHLRSLRLHRRRVPWG